jgi:membrane-associated protease RseP (regulator of RpoE activity)
MQEEIIRPAAYDQAGILLDDIADLFAVDSIALDLPEPGHIRFRGRFLCDLSVCFDELRSRFERHDFTPAIREEEGEVSLIAMPYVFDPPPSNWVINLILLVATIVSTLLVAAVGEIAANSPVELGLIEIYTAALKNLWLGLPFSATLMLILGAHELGHYFAARYHKVPVSLPYFIPMPFSIIGTMGAFIRLKAPIKNRRALLDIGAAGPLAGFVFAVPILLIGLATSETTLLPASGGYTLEGNSILYALMKVVVFGRFLPNGTEDVLLNQVAWAGWVGLLVTALNLIPLGQLDGGHIAYVLFGRRAKILFWPVILALVALTLLASTPTWAIWIVLLFFLGRRYAEPLDDVTELDGRRRVIAIFTLALFILVFVPNPLRFVN